MGVRGDLKPRHSGGVEAICLYIPASYLDVLYTCINPHIHSTDKRKYISKAYEDLPGPEMNMHSHVR